MTSAFRKLGQEDCRKYEASLGSLKEFQGSVSGSSRSSQVTVAKFSVILQVSNKTQELLKIKLYKFKIR